MKHFCPAYPRPRKDRVSIWSLFFSARRSWMDSLYERSYHMQMGEVHLPGLDLYMLNDPVEVRRVLANEDDNFPKSALLGQALAPLLGESIFTTNGAQWQRQRDMMKPAFEQTRLQVSFAAMWAATQALLGRLAALPAGQPQDIEIEMTHVTADVIFRTIFSQALSGAAAHQVFDAFARYQALAPKLVLPAVYGLRWLVWPWERRRSRQAAEEIRSLLAQLIRPRYEAYQRAQAAGQGADQGAGQEEAAVDILASFLAARDAQSGAPFSFDELVNQVGMLFLAGHETSASALTWACYLLAKAPDVQQRMYEQVLAQLGQRAPQASDMRELPLVLNVFREAMRLFPPVGFFARETAQACPMRDKQLPAGATVVIAPWLLHRHRALWSEPDAFNPDRFDDPAVRDAVRQAYLPFSKGQRVCMGAAFALQEAVLILASVVRAYRLEPVAEHTPQPVGRLTIRSANGVLLQLLPRSLD